MGKMGSICYFSRALPASIASEHSGPPNPVKQRNTQNDKSTLFYPPTGGVSLKSVYVTS